MAQIAAIVFMSLSIGLWLGYLLFKPKKLNARGNHIPDFHMPPPYSPEQTYNSLKMQRLTDKGLVVGKRFEIKKKTPGKSSGANPTGRGPAR